MAMKPNPHGHSDPSPAHPTDTPAPKTPFQQGGEEAPGFFGTASFPLPGSSPVPVLELEGLPMDPPVKPRLVLTPAPGSAISETELSAGNPVENQGAYEAGNQGGGPGENPAEDRPVNPAGDDAGNSAANRGANNVGNNVGNSAVSNAANGAVSNASNRGANNAGNNVVNDAGNLAASDVANGAANTVESHVNNRVGNSTPLSPSASRSAEGPSHWGHPLHRSPEPRESPRAPSPASYVDHGNHSVTGSNAGNLHRPTAGGQSGFPTDGSTGVQGGFSAGYNTGVPAGFPTVAPGEPAAGSADGFPVVSPTESATGATTGFPAGFSGQAPGHGGQGNRGYRPPQYMPNQGNRHRPAAPFYQPPPAAGYPQKSRLAAGLLAFFFGALGVHSFYLGYQSRGLVQVLVTLLGGLLTGGFAAFCMLIWGVVEGIQLISGKEAKCHDANNVALGD